MKLHTIEQAEAELAKYVPIVRQITGKDITLERMIPLMEALGNPENDLKVIHVAGTSGKTSTCYYLSALLKESGNKVGLTVSPHLDSVTERVQINLEPLKDTEFCQRLEEFFKLIENVEPTPSYFELLVAFAIWCFKQEGVDYAVLETGLGGLHDATNIVSSASKVCVITDIGYDHMRVLGSTLPEITAQKAGIIHPGNEVFMFAQGEEVNKVVKEASAKNQSRLNILTYQDNQLDIPHFQKRNWQLAKETYDYVAKRDDIKPLSKTQLASTLSTKVPGRMELFELGDKTIIMDGAHNGQKTTALVRSFTQAYPGRRADILLSLKHDKEFEVVLPILHPICDSLIVTEFKTSQDLPAQPIDSSELAKIAKKFGFTKVRSIKQPNKAYKVLAESDNKLGLITGSFYLLSDIRKVLKNS